MLLLVFFFVPRCSTVGATVSTRCRRFGYTVRSLWFVRSFVCSCEREVQKKKLLLFDLAALNVVFGCPPEHAFSITRGFHARRHSLWWLVPCTFVSLAMMDSEGSWHCFVVRRMVNPSALSWSTGNLKFLWLADGRCVVGSGKFRRSPLG